MSRSQTSDDVFLAGRLLGKLRDAALGQALEPAPKLYTAEPTTTVIEVSSETVVLDRGSRHGVAAGQYYLLYRATDEEIRDAKTGESLGYWEAVRGTGRVTSVTSETATLTVPGAQVGDRARRVTAPY